MELSANALKVLESRYLLKNANGDLIETPAELFDRVAKHVAKAELVYGNPGHVEEWEHKFYVAMEQLLFLPNSPTLMNAGTTSGQLSACFVLSVEDSIEGIFSTLKNAALIHQSGGGTGFNFSPLRPKGDFISPNSGGSSGPISFIKLFDAATENIKQGGKRRGANMGILNDDHPDVEEFVAAKTREHVLQNFNLSVGVHDGFMWAALHDSIWELKHPTTRNVVKKIKAKKLWESICKNSRNSGDPGLIFLDTINKYNPTPELGEIACTNPCGEVPLLPYEACNLGSIDVSKFFDRRSRLIRWEELRTMVHTAIRFLDDVVEMNDYLLPRIRTIVGRNRKIGLGIMGWAQLLIEMELPYASDQAVELAGKLMRFINESAFEASGLLSESRGVFRNWKRSIHFPLHPMRNATCTSIAPTGTISILANTSSSIEPIFALAGRREHVLNNDILSEIDPRFLNYLHEKDLYSDELLKEVIREGTAAKTKLPEAVKALFATSTEIAPHWHLKHQIAFQKYTDNAVSKTINLPSGSTEQDISSIFIQAWKQGAKGITVFRNGSRDGQVLHKGLVGTPSSSCRVCRE